MKKKKIAYRRVFQLDEIDTELKARLTAQCERIHLNNFFKSDNFYQLILDRGPGTTLALFYNREHEAVGFIVHNIDLIPFGRGKARVMNAGVHFDTQYNAGYTATKYGLTLGLKTKLKNPLTPLFYVATASSPVPYHLFVRTANTFYPNPYTPTPKKIRNLLTTTAKHRKLELVDMENGVIRYPGDFKLRRQEKLVRGERFSHPIWQHYLKLNPNFDQSQELLLALPLTVSNSIRSLLRV